MSNKFAINVRSTSRTPYKCQEVRLECRKWTDGVLLILNFFLARVCVHSPQGSCWATSSEIVGIRNLCHQKRGFCIRLFHLVPSMRVA